MKTLIRLILLSIIIQYSSASYAESGGNGVFFEPGVSYEVSSASIDYPGPFANSDGKANGLGVFGKLGFHFQDILFAGADARFSWPTFNDTTHNLKASSSSNNFSVLAGAQTPIAGLRLWGAYVFAGGLNPDAYSNGLDMKYTGASGFRLGTGLYLMMVSVNLEYQSLSYDTTVEALGPFPVSTSFSGNKMTNKSFVLSVSLPIFSDSK